MSQAIETIADAPYGVPVMTNRRTWTVSEWAAFFLRCQDARGCLERLIDRVVSVKGARAGLIDAALKARNGLQAAMIKLESVAVKHHAELDAAIIRLVHGDESPRAHVPRANRDFTREEWIALGQEFRDVKARIDRLGADLQSARGVGKPMVERFHEIGAMRRLRSMLDSMACAQHRDWQGATRVFYGPSEAAA